MKEWIIQLLCSFAVLAAIAVAYHWAPQPPQHHHQQGSSSTTTDTSSTTDTSTTRRRSAPWIPHAVALASLLLVCLLLPTSVATHIFSSLTVTVAGTVFPIYESVRAVCTPGEEDDKAWLQYWMVGGVLFMVTGWVGHVLPSEQTVLYFYEVSTFFFVWLYYPLTDGAGLLYYHVTAPYVAPRIAPLAAQMNHWISALYQTLINAMHLWFLWIIFLFLPAGLKRIIAVAVGTVYPLVSSIAAASTEEVADDTYWLTYWSVYGCLFLIMELLETYLGWIPGFYTLVIFTTVYLVCIGVSELVSVLVVVEWLLVGCLLTHTCSLFL